MQRLLHGDEFSVYTAEDLCKCSSHVNNELSADMNQSVLKVLKDDEFR